MAKYDDVLGKSIYILWVVRWTDHLFLQNTIFTWRKNDALWLSGMQEKQQTFIANDKIQAVIKVRILETLYLTYDTCFLILKDLSRICSDTNKCDFLM